jgi:hypothetical protein
MREEKSIMPYYPSKTDTRTLPGLQLQIEAINKKHETTSSIRVKGIIYVMYSSESEPRTINLLFTGEAAKAFMDKDANHIEMIVNKYQGITHDGSTYAGPTLGLHPSDLGNWDISMQEE